MHTLLFLLYFFLKSPHSLITSNWNQMCASHLIPSYLLVNNIHQDSWYEVSLSFSRFISYFLSILEKNLILTINYNYFTIIISFSFLFSKIDGNCSDAFLSNIFFHQWQRTSLCPFMYLSNILSFYVTCSVYLIVQFFFFMTCFIQVMTIHNHSSYTQQYIFFILNIEQDKLNKCELLI